MNRIPLLQRKLDQAQLSAFLVTSSHNIFYLTGFRGLIPEARESILLVDKEGAHLYLPRMYHSEARQAEGVKVHILSERTKLLQAPIPQLKKYKGKIGFEAEDLKFAEYQILEKHITHLVARKNFVSDLRQVKDEEELKHIKKAVQIVDQAFKSILTQLKPGFREKQIARRLVEIMEGLGAEDVAFPPIVASGKGSALAHYRTNNKKIKKGEPLLLDFGAKVNGYCSDLTRVVYMGKAPPKFKTHYNLVLKAQTTAISFAGSHLANLTAEKLHGVALKVLGKKAKFMLHGVGHGIGLQVHEKPFLRKRIKDKLHEGMVVTIEPGLYFEGKYGIRIEDLGVITNSGFQVLSRAPKELIEL